MFAKNVAEIKLFVKELDARIDPIGTHIFLLGIVGKTLCFVMFIRPNNTKQRAPIFI
jgi:hypothetical protein